MPTATKSSYNQDAVTGKSSMVSKSNFTHKNEIYKNLTIVMATKHMTITINRIAYQDKTRNFKRLANLSVKIETVTYDRKNTATGSLERVEPQCYHRRFTNLSAVYRFIVEYTQMINEHMGIN